MRRLVIAVLGGVLVAVVAIVVTSRGESAHRVSFTMGDASSLIPGAKVRAAGQMVGRVTDVSTVDHGRRALIRLSLTNDRVWPLPTDTKIRVRFGGTIALAARYVELDRGTRTTTLADGGTLASANVTVRVEYDEAIGTFGPRTRENLRATVNAAGSALAPAAAPLRATLTKAPPTVRELHGLFSDLGSQDAALGGLVTSTDRVISAADAADPDVGSLIEDAATTFGAVGARAADVRTLLADLPATLGDTRATLRRADPTLRSVTELAGRLRPGVDELRRTTGPLNRTLLVADTVAPDLASTARTLRGAAPDLTRLLDRAGDLMPHARSALTQAATQLACVRPYAPEIAGLASTWSDFVGEGDGKDKYARLYFGTYPIPNGTPLTLPEAAKIIPGPFENYAFPRAPGANAGQPWYQPACGITADGADPQKNPEAKPFDPLSKQVIVTSQPPQPQSP